MDLLYGLLWGPLCDSQTSLCEVFHFTALNVHSPPGQFCLMQAARILLRNKNDGSGPQLSEVCLVSIYWDILWRKTICSTVSADWCYTTCVSREPIMETFFLSIKHDDFSHSPVALDE